MFVNKYFKGYMHFQLFKIYANGCVPAGLAAHPYHKRIALTPPPPFSDGPEL